MLNWYLNRCKNGTGRAVLRTYADQPGHPLLSLRRRPNFPNVEALQDKGIPLPTFENFHAADLLGDDDGVLTMEEWVAWAQPPQP